MKSAIITYSNFTPVRRICLRCLMHCDANGDPDPAVYSPESIRKFRDSKEEKCTHTTQNVLKDFKEAVKDLVDSLPTYSTSSSMYARVNVVRELLKRV